ncbi:GrpB family protein [Nocardioides kribbensis]|uniref:GrpB family protein n=1 Tax=Nocardioides kribbensis TaxID=305517 RepID=A0ABV1NUP2_9ACTN
MPTRAQIVSFVGDEAPPGASPWVAGRGPSPYVAVVEPDPSWPERSAQVAATVRGALGWRVLALEHVGSTAVAGLAAKPTLDLDLVLADPDAEDAYVPALEALGFVLTVRQPWWQGHRLLRLDPPALGESLGCHLHVFGPDSAEPWKHRLFRDWLRAHPDERELYAAAKRSAADAASAAGEHSMLYNARKQDVVRAIYARAFRAAGLSD